MNHSPFFIVGVPRSGTTMLAVILNEHSKLHVGPNAYGHQIARILGRLQNELSTKDDYERFDFEQQLKKRIEKTPRLNSILEIEKTKSLTERIQITLSKIAAAEGKQIFGDKCPPVIDLIQELRSVIPDARFIHVIRDGRSVALSQQKRQNTDAILAIHRWKKSVIQGEIWQRVLATNEFMAIKFEDLVSHPAESIHQVCEFLEVDYEPAMHDLSQHRMVQASNAYVMPKPDASKIDTWLSADPQLVNRMERIAGDVLRRYEYSLASNIDTKKIAALSRFKELWLELQSSIRILGIREVVVMREQKLVVEERSILERMLLVLRKSTAILLPKAVRDWFLKRSPLF